MRRLPLPPPRPVLHPLRAEATARTAVHRFPGHRRRITIDHRPLDGVTPAMLDWWFRHIGGSMDYAGTRVPNYLVWHPLDHIRWELARSAPGGGVAEGARFRIVEAFGRRPDFSVDTTDTVEKLDPTGIRLVRRLAGVPVLQLEHTWSAGEGRTHYVTVLDVGARSRLFRPVNRFIAARVFPDALLRAWVVHNIEEVGHLERFLPALFAAQSRPGPQQAATSG